MMASLASAFKLSPLKRSGRDLLFFVQLGIALWTTTAFTATADQDEALAQGEYFLANHNFTAAITEFKRFIFFHPNGKELCGVYERMAQAYAEQENWQQALLSIRQAIGLAKEDSVVENLQLTLSTMQLAKGESSSAEFELTKLVHFSSDSVIRCKAHFFLGICQVYQYKWQDARTHFLQSQNIFPNIGGRKVDSLLVRAGQLAYKSPKTAKWSSTFIPGLGQLYAGDWFAAINALTLNSLTGYALYQAAAGGQIMDIFIAYMTIFDRYYQGNRFHAEKTAGDDNERKNREQAEKIILLLQNQSYDEMNR